MFSRWRVPLAHTRPEDPTHQDVFPWPYEELSSFGASPLSSSDSIISPLPVSPSISADYCLSMPYQEGTYVAPSRRRACSLARQPVLLLLLCKSIQVFLTPAPARIIPLHLPHPVFSPFHSQLGLHSPIGHLIPRPPHYGVTGLPIGDQNQGIPPHQIARATCISNGVVFRV